MKAVIIGVGGVGSWMTPALCNLVDPENVILVDGDRLEPRNLDRQLFHASEIKQNKAQALARRHQCRAVAQWYGFGTLEHAPNDWLLVCVDNHAGRLEALKACDYFRCSAILAGNEVHSSEAYAYLPRWKDTRLDPRVFYPELLTDLSGDPRSAAMGCTGEAQQANRQLVTANLMAASLALHLFVVWAMEARKLDAESLPHLPHRLRMNLSKAETFKAQTENPNER